MLGSIALVILVLFALLADLIAPYGLNEVNFLHRAPCGLLKTRIIFLAAMASAAIL